MQNKSKQILFFDADDTLWECNHYFRSVMHQFCERFSGVFSKSHEDIYNQILDFEHKRLSTYGYGSLGFIQCLRDVFTCLNDKSLNKYPNKNAMDFISEISCTLIEFKIDLLNGVTHTLENLSNRGYEMHLLTKGDFSEQMNKISKSQIDHYFINHKIFNHKREEEYLEYLDEKNLKPHETVMIGNSPKSDIIPCLNIGMKAVFIPHHSSWELEHAEIPDHPNKSQLSNIIQLLDIFL